MPQFSLRKLLPRVAATVLSLTITSVQPLTITSDPASVPNQTYDYIVVGGGTAGLTIANRLTEDKHTTVLVIEAGENLQNDTRITDPGMFAVANISDINWMYATTNQTVGGKQQVINAGKVLGGSSAINGMQWTRGTIGQYDALEELGNEGWNFKTMQMYMKKAELFHLPTANQTALGVTFDPSAHGTQGRIDSGFPNPYPCPSCKLWDALVEATVEVFPGIRANNDQDSGDPRGVARCSYSITPGTSDGETENIRSSSAHGYVYSLSPGERPNLSILTGHTATKIVWKTSNKHKAPTPAGVAFDATTSSNSFMARVAKEVIVTSGALGSPKFLELSGIGDRRLLEKFNIPVVVDLPSVGTNLQDQANIVTEFNGTEILVNAPVGHAPAGGAAAFVTLTQMLGSEAATAYVQSLQSTIISRAKDIVSSGASVSLNGTQRMLAIQAREFGKENAPVVEFDYLFLPGTGVLGSSSWLLLPQSRGTVHIASSDPHVPPTANPNYLSVQQDFSLLVNVSMALRRIYTAPAMKQFTGLELIPGTNVQSDEDVANFVTNFAAVLHPIGSVSMLPRELGGAVDSQLRVYGVHGVRVADASVLPIQVSAHLSSTVYGIAEKAADLIRGK